MAASDELRGRVKEVLADLVAVRHALHQIPELHFQETETQAVIRRFLADTALEVHPPLIGTDTVATLRGAADGPCILLRSDIDALPVHERTGVAWSSRHDGRAHSCGHDGHMAILLGTARVLSSLADRLHGTVRFVFQPAEEESAGGKVLIEKGLLDLGPRPGMAFAFHGWPGLAQGTISSGAGPAMAAADSFRISVRGKGGHAAEPHHGADPVLAAAQVVTALHTLVSRAVDPREAALLSVCRIEGGHASNVIPDEVTLEGTTRSYDEGVQDLMRQRVQRTVDGICAAAGCTGRVEYDQSYVPLVNHGEAVALAARVVADHLGPSSWQPRHPPSMTAEDFAYYLQHVPGALLRLGLGEQWPPLHSPGFDFNDEALEPGVTTMAGLALAFCGGPAAGGTR
ncbi:MAG TPA: amidohydrolase [Spirochaetia bacterium]|nr:amidohydrolase [Spirochaetia bacterium]